MFKSMIKKNCNEDSLKVIQYIYGKLNNFNYKNYNWVIKSGAGYEKEFCKLLNWNFVNERHWDCEFNDIKIELKKSKSNGIQVDEIRYAEEELEIDLDCMENIITIFMEIYSKESKKTGIRKIMIVQNKEIIKLLKFDKVPNLTKEEYCAIIIDRNKNIKGSLSFTHRLKYCDLIKVADAYIVFK